MSSKIELPFLKIKLGGTPTVIAEIGINHNGCINNAIKMAGLAIKSGANIIKHQTHFVDDEMSLEAKRMKVGYIGDSIWNLMEKCALSKDEEIKLKKFVESKKITYLSTPFSRSAADFLNDINVPAFKIGSGECNNFPLIEHISNFGKPIILSTGMNDLKSIDTAVKIMKKKKVRFALMHTTNSYPTPDKSVRLGGLSELKNKYKNTIIGISDHTIGNLACFSGVALGADIVERHFTDSMKRKGPDIVCSMDPISCKELTEGVKRIAEMRGGKKGLVDCEKKVANFAFGSVVSSNKIKKGEKLTTQNIWVRRPGNGFYKAKDYTSLIGKIASRDIKNNFQLKKNDIKKN